ncbi:MAG: NUDIX hydrolase [Pseudomonadales bacterium]|nr:NUDIX hydrolase [Pseudomonadales bacterium]NIX07251.1 NUDIX hydrolase [Pseudomonadales bacterium]
MSQVQPIRPAATVILVRDASEGFEILMLKRTSGAAFAGGMFVFPGGRVDGDDHLHRYDEHRVGPSDEQDAQRQALGAEWRGYWIAGIRESFEEAGLLLAYTPAGELLAYDDDDVEARFQSYRGPLHAGEVSLETICRQEGLRLAVDRIHFHSRFVTPLGRPRRFDTRFFIAEAPPGQTGRHDDKETVDSIWISPREALARHAADEFGLMGVTKLQLEGLAGYGSKAEVLAAAACRSDFPTRRPVLPASER